MLGEDTSKPVGPAEHAWMVEPLGPTRTGWYTEAVNMNAIGCDPDVMKWACRYREVAKELADVTVERDVYHDTLIEDQVYGLAQKQRADAAEAERDRLAARVAEMEAILHGEPKVIRAVYDHEKGTEVAVEHWAVKHIVASLADSLYAGRDPAKANYVQTVVHGHERGPIEVTIRKFFGGLTPAEKLAAAESRVAELEAALRPLLRAVEEWERDSRVVVEVCPPHLRKETTLVVAELRAIKAALAKAVERPEPEDWCTCQRCGKQLRSNSCGNYQMVNGEWTGICLKCLRPEED